jgi:ATP-dependent RNA helicase DeaD
MSTHESSTGAFLALGVHPAIAAAIEARGYTTPTAVQTALLDPDLDGQDILVSSQTGSGKTVAFGLLLAPSLQPSAARGGCAPQAVVIAPTRELANQVREELAWLLAPVEVRVVAVTGGTSIGGELRALSSAPEIVVGTPGRLLDHLRRGAIETSAVATVVLDEADEMLDMGFREELEAILEALPAERRTVMLSATLPEGIVALAARYQRDAVRIAVERPGTANADIAHVAHLVRPADKLHGLVNVLLAAPEERTMVFVRTRADAGETAAALANLGFPAAALTGEMAQRERTQTLDAFRAGRVAVLVATDLAARGIDVPEVTRVIHADLPGDPAALTHRSGRTGRAGRKGTSIMIVPPHARTRARELLRAAGVRATWRPVPSAEEIASAADARLHQRLATEAPEGATSPRHLRLAEALLEGRDPVALVARLLGELRYDGPCAPRAVAPIELPAAKPAWSPRPAHGALRGHDEGRAGPRSHDDARYVMFRVNFGEKHGATPARLLAMVCRRGGVQGRDVGAIAIGGAVSTFGVSPAVARAFARAASRPDTRDPHVRIEQLDGAPPHRPAPAGPRRRSEWSTREA